MHFKKVLGGMLLREQRRIALYVRALENDAKAPLSDERLSECATYVSQTLGATPPDSLAGAEREQRVAYLLSRLQRPLRVSGMVPSDGKDTGGGPFWVAGKDGAASIQVVETAQIAVNDPAQGWVVAFLPFVITFFFVFCFSFVCLFSIISFAIHFCRLFVAFLPFDYYLFFAFCFSVRLF